MADVRKELSFCEKVGVNVLGVVENMSGLAAPVTRGGATFKVGAPNANERAVDADAEALTAKIRSVIEAHCAETGADPNTARLELDVFAATRGGAAKMCADRGVPFLGRVPLDPAIAAAAERGASLFDDDAHTSDAANVGNSASYAAVRAVVDGVRAAVGET